MDTFNNTILASYNDYFIKIAQSCNSISTTTFGWGLAKPTLHYATSILYRYECETLTFLYATKLYQEFIIG